jgi:hypothetical protein
MSRKIAICGNAESGRHAPYSDPSWEIWGVAARQPFVTRADRWFESHRLSGYPTDWARDWRALMKATLADVPVVYMLYPEPLLPNIERYPYERIVQRFGTYFITSSFAYMLAMAIDELAPRGEMAEPGSTIGVFGVDPSYGTEYRHQRTGTRHFMELAEQLGIAVERQLTSAVVMDPLPYPLTQDDPLLNKLRTRNKLAIETREAAERAIKINREAIASAKAALAEIDLMQALPFTPEGEDAPVGKAYDPEQRRAALQTNLQQLFDTANQSTKKMLEEVGREAEQNFFMDYLLP